MTSFFISCRSNLLNNVTTNLYDITFNFISKLMYIIRLLTMNPTNRVRVIDDRLAILMVLIDYYLKRVGLYWKVIAMSPFKANVIKYLIVFCLCVIISREMFDKWQAQRWWSENCEKIMELYNVQRFNQQGVPLPSPPRSEDEVSCLCFLLKTKMDG